LVTSPIVELYRATAFYAVAAALARPGLQRLIPTTVPAAIRDRAIALEDAGFHLARLAGALVGGALLATAGAAPCFAVNAVSFLVVVVMIGITQFDLEQFRRSRAQALKTRQWLREVRRRADLRALAVFVVAFASLGLPLVSLAPVIADRYSTSPLFLGIFVSAFALGGMVASIVLARVERRDLSRHPVLAASTCACGLAIAALAVFPPLPLTLVTAGTPACTGCTSLTGREHDRAVSGEPRPGRRLAGEPGGEASQLAIVVPPGLDVAEPGWGQDRGQRLVLPPAELDEEPTAGT
jgi:MFS family permease